MVFIYAEWCLILCLEENKKYTASAAMLESEDGLGLTESDLENGRKVIWHYHRLPYDAEILEVLGKDTNM